MVRRLLVVFAWTLAPCAVAVAVLHSLWNHDLSSPTAFATAGTFVLAVLLSAILNRPSTPILLTAASTAVALAAMLHLDASDPGALTPDLLALCAIVTLVIGLGTVVRTRLGASAVNVLADGLMVAIGSWLVVWVVLAEPLVSSSTATDITIVRGATLGGSIVVLFLLATLLFSDASPRASTMLLGTSALIALAGFITRAVSQRADVVLERSTVASIFLASAVAAGAGMLHPTVRDAARPGPLRLSPPLTTRLVTTTVSLVAPVILLALTDPHDGRDRVVRAASVGVLAVAATIRIVQSVRDNARTQDRLVRNALTDPLTGLPNRTLMLEYISESLRSAWRTHRRPTVLFIDVDRFKNINDSLGHSIGDDVLTHVATRITGVLSPSATVARIAGDEFVVLDPDTESPAQSVSLAERVLDALREPVRTAEGDMFVTASVGVAYASDDHLLKADDLMRHADTAMYRAKGAGRNCIALFDESMLAVATGRLEMETALYRALERGELRLVHQPIIDIDLGIVVGFEALMRWDRTDGRTVAPSDFIPIAEETGTIVPLGTWAINDALSHLRRWIDTGVVSTSTTMSVNVSARQLVDPQFVDAVSNALVVSGLSAEHLWLEVTESVMITETAQTLQALRRLNSMGVRVAVDDFGTGYSSLSMLQRFPVQCVKIDRTFVQELGDERETQNLVRTIVAMADSLNADIVAEGIETEQQLTQLAAMRCHRAQGYLISPPIAAEHVPAAVQRIQDTTWV